MAKHHIIPTSRGGENNGSNRILVGRQIHNIYHRLFKNKTPEEIVDYLNKQFWGGKYAASIEKLNKEQ